MTSSQETLQNAAEYYARTHYTNPKLLLIESGTHSQAWKLTCNEGEFALRANTRDSHFKRDKLISEKIKNVRVPEVIDIKKASDDSYVCVSQYIDGQTLADSIKSSGRFEHKKIFVENIMHIHSSDISKHLEGYGKIASGKGENKSWGDFLAGLYRNDTVKEELAELVEQDLVKNSVVEDAQNMTRNLLDDTDNLENLDKYLLHGDYQPNNIILSNDHLYIIDWGNSKLGDFVYDLVWTSMHPPSLLSLDELLAVYKDNDFDMKNINERVLLCKISIYISWMINSFNNKKYDLVRNDVRGLRKMLNEL